MGLMPPACSVATPVQPESNQNVSASVQWRHTLNLAEQALQRDYTHGRDHRHWRQPQAPLLSVTRAMCQATVKKTKGSAGEGAGAPWELSALLVTGPAAGHVVLPGLSVLAVSSRSWSWRGNGRESTFDKLLGTSEYFFFFNKTLHQAGAAYLQATQNLRSVAFQGVQARQSNV